MTLYITRQNVNIFYVQRGIFSEQVLRGQKVDNEMLLLVYSSVVFSWFPHPFFVLLGPL